MAAIVLLLAAATVAGVAFLDGGEPVAAPSPVPTVVLWTGLFSDPEQTGASPSVHLPILMYHYVDEEPPPAGPYADGLTVRTPDFREEMDYLAENGYRAVLLEDVAAVLESGATSPAEKLVALTFDDGGLDNYTVAFPILREHGFTATFFVISGKVGGEGFMTWDQLKEMRAAGMSIQSHTRSHPDLTGLGAEALSAQLVGSRADIEDAVGAPVQVLCYPSGSYDDTVIAAARAAGYTLAVTTEPGADLDPAAPFALPRVRIPAFMPIASFAKAVQ